MWSRSSLKLICIAHGFTSRHNTWRSLFFASSQQQCNQQTREHCPVVRNCYKHTTSHDLNKPSFLELALRVAEGSIAHAASTSGDRDRNRLKRSQACLFCLVNANVLQLRAHACGALHAPRAIAENELMRDIDVVVATANAQRRLEPPWLVESPAAELASPIQPAKTHPATAPPPTSNAPRRHRQ